MTINYSIPDDTEWAVTEPFDPQLLECKLQEGNDRGRLLQVIRPNIHKDSHKEVFPEVTTTTP